MNTPIRTFAWFLAGLFLLVSSLQAQNHTKVYDGNLSIKTVVPVIQVETTGPADINVGKTATYVITVKNVGDTPAEGVIVRTQLPKTVRYESANLKPEAIEEGAVRFYLGDLPSQANRQITLNLIPQKAGPVDLSTRASFSTSTMSSLNVRKSSLKIKAIAPLNAQYGETVTLKLVVSNTGDGTAEDVTVVPQVPDNVLANAEGTKPIEIGVLPPGESREILYAVNAVTSRSIDVAFEAFDATGSKVDTKASIRVLRPMLNVVISGPTLRYVNRPGEYTIRVTNPGDAPVENVEVIAAIDGTMRVTAIARAAKYDRGSNTLTWYLPSVDPGSETHLSLKAVATETGEHTHQVVATNNAGLVANAERVTQVVSRPNIYAAVINEQGETEVYQPASFTVLLVNRGHSAAENVEVIATLPDGFEALPSDEVRIEGNQLKFDPVTLNVGEQHELHFQAVSAIAGDHTVRISYQGDSMTRPLTIEGQAFFYDDKQPGAIAERLDVDQKHPEAIVERLEFDSEIGGPQLFPR